MKSAVNILMYLLIGFMFFMMFIAPFLALLWILFLSIWQFSQVPVDWATLIICMIAVVGAIVFLGWLVCKDDKCKAN